MSLREQRFVVPAVYISAMFMSVLDTTIVTVALPTIGRQLHAGTSQLALVSVVYLISLAVFIPISSWLADRLGSRRTLLGAIALFTLASALCGLSTNLPELLAFRVLQGVGGAVMTPVGLAMVFRIYPPAERVRIAGTIAVFVTLGPALGPILGGLFTTYLTWRLAFFVNLPVGLLALLLGATRLEDQDRPAAARLDLAGLLLSASGFGAFVYAISTGAETGWSSPQVLAPLLAGLALLAGLVRVELRSARPLIDLRLLADRSLSSATALYGLGSVAYLGTLFLAALFFQDALHLSAIQSGLTTFPAALGTMAASQLITRRLHSRYGPQRIIATGLVVLAAGTALLALVGPDTSLWLVRVIMLAVGAGVAGVFIPSQAMSMATIDKASTGQASAIFNASKQLGSALGVALLGTVLTAATPHGHTGSLAGYRAGFVTAAVIALAALAVAGRRTSAVGRRAAARPVVMDVRSGPATVETDVVTTSAR